MKRTNPPQTNGSAKGMDLSTADLVKLQNLSAVASRLALSRKLGLSHKGERDLYSTLGYKQDVEAEDLRGLWERNAISRAVVDRPVKKTWQGDLTITEPNEEDSTQLQEDFEALDDKLGLKRVLMRADRLAQLGEYSVLLLGFDDSSDQTWSTEVEGSDRDLMYVRPIGKENVDIKTYETDASNPRFGLPRLYQVDLEQPDNAVKEKTKEITLDVHHSRIIHIAFDLLENEVEGNPVMKTAYNRLKDLEKLVGGAAEMFWRGARPGYFSSAKEDYSVDSGMEKDFKEQIEEYENDLRRILMAEGVDMQSLEQQIASPEDHVKVQLQMVSALTGIPLRILIGSERGELASSQDQQAYKEFISTRRTEEVEPIILRPFVDRLIKYGVLSDPTDKQAGYSTEWSDLFSLGEKDKADIGQKKAGALTKYLKQPEAEMAVPLEAFLKYFLQMDDDQVEQILEMRDSELEEALAEEAELEETEEQMQEIDEAEDMAEEEQAEPGQEGDQ